MSVFGGMVREDMTPKAWGGGFHSLAQNLSILPQPAPKLPAYDFTACLTAPLDETMSVHQEYAGLVQKALKEAGPVAEIK